MAKFEIKKKLKSFALKEYDSAIEFNACVLQKHPSGKVGIEPHRDKEITRDTNIWHFNRSGNDFEYG